MNKYFSITVLLLLSWGITFYVLFGEGINIVNTYHQEQYQNQQQAQLIISLFAAQGALSWEANSVNELNEKGFHQDGFVNRIAAFLNSLAPEQSLMAKIIGAHGDYFIFVPVIIEDKSK